MGWKMQRNQKIDLHNYNYWLRNNADPSQRDGLVKKYKPSAKALGMLTIMEAMSLSSGTMKSWHDT
tara:strand:+ start:1118 stop:1315 length:198 start_codon:yes stop_codon:yes gene_type:complete